MKADYKLKLNGTYIFLGFIFILYQVLSSVFLSTPPLYGIFFCYMFFLFKEKEKTYNKFDFRWYFSLFFLFFTDITYGFFVFSSWIAFFIFYYAFADWIKTNLKIGKFISVIFVLCTYALIFIVDRTFTYMNNEEMKMFALSFVFSLLVESLLAYIIFRGKMQ
ncbi:hypothetical protein OQH60_00335 [Campylobacter sp. MIT 21-1685]|uniref:hypothetical protein n=1 Tax=unclassified Campylobacter TaxID=2593542 RepID=UPI00224B900D|nr:MULTISPECIES: hypothetical protein [unclassified Campylobacter]MCX2682367.1 hypothetical protein [Campylobacter sp. MIT 21-1684]MCX2750647.1 hypothetical protein [Campylobacter sp. MIT 21-1682]MCX2806805.1 hypothetical protein [Campylobacter sp. MIT 21-1685]